MAEAPEVVAGPIAPLPVQFQISSLRRAQLLLSKPQVCQLCNVTPAASYCFHCAVKFCANCRDVKVCVSCRHQHGHHTKHRGSGKAGSTQSTGDGCSHSDGASASGGAEGSHRFEDLSTLTPEDLLPHLLWCCHYHSDKQAGAYCHSHLQLACWNCVYDFHARCQDVRLVPGSQEHVKLQIFQLNQEVKNKLKAQQASHQNHFNQQRAKVHEVFNDLEQRLEEQRRSVNSRIDDMERTELSELENLRESLKQHKDMISHTLALKNDALVVKIAQELEPQTKELEERCAKVNTRKDAKELVRELIKQENVDYITDTLASLGSITQLTMHVEGNTQRTPQTSEQMNATAATPSSSTTTSSTTTASTKPASS